jgi:parvulin-like peptidyl-prolyl isomerase
MNIFRWLSILAAACLALPARAEPQLADGVKAIVNDTVITYFQVKLFIAPAAEALARQYASQPDAFDKKYNDLISDGLEQLIQRQLILHTFDVEGYRIPDSYIDELVQDRIREEFAGDRITMIKTLQARGQTFEQYRKDVRDQYIVSALRAKNVSQEIIISPFKVESYYLAHQDDFKLADQVKLRMIVLNKTSSDETNTPALAREILSKLKEGTAFGEMAAVYSQGSQRLDGGDWGWVERPVLRKELADTAFSLKAGQLSDVIETPEACYIMLVEQTSTAHVKPLNEVRNDVEKTLRAQEQTRLEKDWIDSLKKKTFIRYF